MRTYLDVSTIHGIGLFAAEWIPQGTPVWRYVRGFDVKLTEVARKTAPKDFIDRYVETCPMTGVWLLCADDARFINHSEDPNVTTSVPLAGHKPDCAARDIKVGEEITMDYRITDSRPWAGFERRPE